MWLCSHLHFSAEATIKFEHSNLKAKFEAKFESKDVASQPPQLQVESKDAA
jgi:hypothetical protein